MATSNDIKQMTTTSNPGNLTRFQIWAIESLQDRPDLEIKALYKGKNIVLMTKTYYESTVMRILLNKQCYSRLSETRI